MKLKQLLWRALTGGSLDFFFEGGLPRVVLASSSRGRPAKSRSSSSWSSSSSSMRRRAVPRVESSRRARRALDARAHPRRRAARTPRRRRARPSRVAFWRLCIQRPFSTKWRASHKTDRDVRVSRARAAAAARPIAPELDDDDDVFHHGARRRDATTRENKSTIVGDARGTTTRRETRANAR